jgi:hypothetical protein
MPFRMLPNTDATRIAALDAAATKAATVPEADRPYPSAVQAQLTSLGPNFKQQATEAGTALSEQGVATSQATLDFLALQAVVSHFFQVFNLAVGRGVIPREARAHYQLDISSAALPDLITQADVLLWAGRIATGEAARVATAGAVPMAMPSADEVATAATAYDTSARTQTEKKDAYDDEQGEVAALRPDADKLIRDIWDYVEFAHRAEPGPGKRRKAREWGVTYLTRPGETPDPEDPETPSTPQPPPVEKNATTEN